MARTISPTIWGWISWATAGSVIFAGTWWVLAQDNSSIFFDDTNSRLGLMTTAPTHTLTLWSTGTGIALYNTADQTTNYEQWSLFWSSNTFTLQTLNAGSGTARTLQLRAFSGGSSTNISISKASAPFWNFFTSSSASSWNRIQMLSSTTASGSSWVQTFQAIIPTINQTSTAWWTIIDLNPTVTASWSWAKNAILYRNASWSTLFGVDHLWAFSCSNTVAVWAAVASTHKVTVVIGWTTYYLLASNV